MVWIICLLLLISMAADAAQLGRTTADVNFREGPGLSAPIIQILPSGSEVSVSQHATRGWYQVLYRGRRGFIHKHYVKLFQDQSPDGWWESKYVQLAQPAGMVLAGIGIILIASVLMPTLLTTATVLVVALIAVVVCDLLFQIGMLYSLFCVSFGVFAILLFLRKRRDPLSANVNETLTRQ